MKLKALFCMFILCLNLGDGMAQTNVRLGARTSAGSIIAHSADLRPISQSTPFGLSATVQWMKTNRKNWEACNCFHYLGLEAFYYNFNNPSILGAASGILGMFEPILLNNRPWVLSLRTGIGMSYLNNVHDSINNPENIFFSNPLSFLLFVSPVLEYQFSSQWSSSFSLNYNHISNGGQKQPNKGMNFPMLELGLFRYFSHDELPQYDKIPVTRLWQLYTEAAFTTKSTGTTERKPVFMLAAEVYRPLSAINAFGIGMDLSKDYSLETGQPRRTLVPAPFIAHHLLLGRIDFSQWMALYLTRPDSYSNHRFYQRYILRYKMGENLSAGIGLKVHGHVAENIDFRFAWHW